jgi:DNA-binding PadR family transcriptional regulator
MLNRAGLDILIHPLTDNSVDDTVFMRCGSVPQLRSSSEPCGGTTGRNCCPAAEKAPRSARHKQPIVPARSRCDPQNEEISMSGIRHTRGERRHPRSGLSFGHGRFGGHDHGGRGGRRGRVFEHGDLRYVLLRLIAEKPRYGYELIKTIEEQLGGRYCPSPGVIYPTLTLLEELGYVRVDSAGATKKLYSVTAAGLDFLADNRDLVERIFARLAEIGRAAGAEPAPEIQRAVSNLEMALAIRLGKGSLDGDQVRAITQTLDRAAAEIERI